MKDRLARGFTRASVGISAHARTTSITLWPDDGSAVRIHSQMHDIAERREVGVLEFENADIPFRNEIKLSIPRSFNTPLAVSKLLIVESNAAAESGIVLAAEDGREIVIVAGVSPYSLAIDGIYSAPHAFEPEYPMEKYIRSEWT